MSKNTISTPKLSNLRISAKDRMQLMGNISTMLKAGIPILEVIESLLEEIKGPTQKVLQTIKADLQAGRMIHESLAKYPASFNKVTISLIKAAEEAGNLEVALKDVQDGIKSEMEFTDKIKSAMVYPIFVLLVFVGVLVMMLVVVMPKVSQVFGRLNMKLPLATKLLIAASDAVTGHYMIAIGIVVGLIVFFALFFKYKRNMLANLLFSLPVLAKMVRQIDLTRFARNMSLLLGSGLPIVTALDLAEDVIVKKDLFQLVVAARGKITSGMTLAEGLRSPNHLISGIVIKLIDVGERTGTLQQAMKDVTEMLDYEVSKSIKTATTLLEPIMLVFVGITVGGMMMSIIAPMYGMISSVSSGF